MDAFSFSKKVIQTCSAYPFVKTITITLLDEPVVKIRAQINDTEFVEIFNNAVTGRFSYALIRDGRRVFGADNTHGWHLHPFGCPDDHVDSEEISLETFLDMIGTERHD